MTGISERLLRLLSVQTRDAVSFGGTASLTSWLHEKDYDLGLEVETGMVIATHRASKVVRMVPSTNIIGMAPEPTRPEPAQQPPPDRKRAGRA